MSGPAAPPPRRRHRSAGRLAALLVVVLAGAGCSALGTERSADGRILHGAGDGPLLVAGGGGGNSIQAPGRVPWFATFGWATPCTTTGEPVTIERIRYRFEVEPISVRSVVFRARRGNGVIGFGSTRGTPEASVRKGQVLGRFEGPPEGFVVTRLCAEHPARTDQILTVLETGRRGAEITDYAIDYTSAGEVYTLAVDWQLVACGTDTSPDMCR